MKRRLTADPQITAFFHCARCMNGRPDDQSPAEWGRLEAGWTKRGLQIRCHRCDANVLHVDFEGLRHPAITSAE